MEMICLVLVLLCVGVSMLSTAKNEKLAKETREAKKDYWSVKSNSIKLESCLRDAMEVIKESTSVNSLLQEGIASLKIQVQEQSGFILEQSKKLAIQGKLIEEQTSTIDTQNLVISKQGQLLDEHHKTLVSMGNELATLNERVECLEADNKILKQRLNIHTQVAKHSKVVVPFQARM